MARIGAPDAVSCNANAFKPDRLEYLGRFCRSWSARDNKTSDRLWRLIFAVRGTSTAMIKRQSQLLFGARMNIGSSEQRNKWKGPALGGKEAVYAGCSERPRGSFSRPP